MANLESFSDKADGARRWLWWPVWAAVLTRALYWWSHSRSPFFAAPLLDQEYYHRVALAIASGESLLPFGGFRPLLYPLYLSVWYRVAGPDQGLQLALLSQHLLGVGTVAMVGIVACRLFRSRAAGGLGAWLLALSGPPMYFEGELLIATLMAALVALMFLFLSSAVTGARPDRWIPWLAAGTAAGLAVQARPNALLFLPALAGLWGWRVWRGESTGRRQVLGALGAATLVLAGFGFVNRWQAGRYQLMTSAGGINFYLGNHRNADGMIPRQGASVAYAGPYQDSVQLYAEQEYRRVMVETGGVPSSDPRAVSRYWYGRAIEHILDDPLRWAGLLLRKVGYLCANREIANNKTYSFVAREESVLLRLLPVRWWLLFGLFPIGVVAAWRHGHRTLLALLLLFIALYGAGIIAFFVNARFRIPLWPPFCILASGAICLIPPLSRPARQRLALLGMGFGFALWSLIAGAALPPEDYARDYYFRSLARLSRGDVDGALADVERSLKLDPENHDAWFQLGNCRFALGQYDESADLFGRLTRVEPEESRIWNNLGVALERAGRTREADDAYRKALAVDGANLNARINAAWIALRAGRDDDAEHHLRTLAARQVERVDALVAFSLSARRRGRSDQAAAFLSRARQLDPEWVDELLRKAETPLL